METNRLLADLCRKRLHEVPFCYGVKDERLGMLEIQRAELADARAKERLREECETRKLFKALQDEKNAEFVRRKRLQQMVKRDRELQELTILINSAKVAQELVCKLKWEDEIIEQRFAAAQKEALECRAEYRAWEQKQKQLQEQKRLEGSIVAEILRTQIEDKNAEIVEAQREKQMERQEMLKKVEENMRQERLEHEAVMLAKQAWRREALENIRQKKEYLLQQDINDGRDGRFVQSFFEMTDAVAARKQKEKEKWRHNFERQQAMSARLGAENMKVQLAKDQLLTEIVDWHVKERLRNIDRAHEAAKNKAHAQQRIFMDGYKHYLAEKEAQKIRELDMGIEIALQRQPLTCEEQDQVATKPTEAERYLRHKFLLEQSQFNRERRAQSAQAHRELLDSIEKYDLDHHNDIQLAKYRILSETPIETLRYIPSSVLRSDFMPEPYIQKIRQQIQNDPIPMLNIKRHQPHTRQHLEDCPRQVKCCLNCPRTYKISNIF